MATARASSATLTVEQLLELHPWPAAFAREKRIERLWTFDLPGTPQALWPFISDTSRMNRALGTAEMTFSEKDGKRYGTSQGGRREARVARGAVELGRRSSG